MGYDDDNEDGLGGTDRLAAILVHVGAARKGIRRLEGDVRDIKTSVDELRDRSVSREHCTTEHAKVDRSLRELQQEIRKKPTGGAHPAVGTPAAQHMAAQMASGNTGSMAIPKTPEEVIEEQREKARKTITFWLGAIAAVSALVGGAALGLVKLGRYLDRVDTAVEASMQKTERLRNEIRKELANSRTVYIRAPAPSDAGLVGPIAPKRKASPRRPRPAPRP